jgi:hypothetical protein
MNQAQIDFQQLRIKHILFKSKVRSVLYGGTIDEVFFSSAGPISVWFSTVGTRYFQKPEMMELKQIYQNLEATARSLFGLYAQGKMEQAQNGLAELESLSEKFLNVVARLESNSSS